MQHVAATPKGRSLAKPGASTPTRSRDYQRRASLKAYRNILTARFVDSKILVLLKQGKVFFHIGGSGHESAQTAFALAMKPGTDWAYPYYRDLAFSLSSDTRSRK